MNVGRILGIQLHLHPSWLIVFALVFLSLGVGVFPAWHPDWSPALSWAVSLAAAVLFFASILLHELAHSLAARAFGVPVRRITLFLFGGVASIENDPPSAGSEFLIALVGPVSSLLLGFGFLALGDLTSGGSLRAAGDPMRAVAALDPVATLFVWLGPINVLLAVFNLIPGYPLDGGRLLRATLWSMTGDRIRATRWAAGTGQFVGMLLVAGGVAMALGIPVPFLGQGLLNGAWLAFLGWFLGRAATVSARQVALQHALEGVPVARLVPRDVQPVPPERSIRQLVDEWLPGRDDRPSPVMTGGRLVGLVTPDDVRRLDRGRWDTTRVSDLMTPEGELEVVQAEVGAGEVLRKLVQRNIDHMLVLEGGRILGLVRRADILRWAEWRSGFAG